MSVPKSVTLGWRWSNGLSRMVRAPRIRWRWPRSTAGTDRPLMLHLTAWMSCSTGSGPRAWPALVRFSATPSRRPIDLPVCESPYMFGKYEYMIEHPELVTALKPMAEEEEKA